MRHDPWLTEISPDDIEAAMQRKAAREALIVEQAARIAELEAALRLYADDNYNGYNGNGAHARAALEGGKS